MSTVIYEGPRLQIRPKIIDKVFNNFICAIAYFLICERIITLGKIKAIFQKIYFRNVNAIVLGLPNVFIVRYGIAKRLREIIRGSVMCRYLTTTELI